MTKNKLIAIAGFAIVVFVGILFQPSDEVVVKEPDRTEEVVKTVVVEREVDQQVLNIEAVHYVCHSGRRHFAVYYQKPNGKTTWFIAANPSPKECDGKEKVHPEIRDKIRKEDEARREAEEKS